MTQEAVGNDGITISSIYSMLDSIFNEKFKMACPNINAARMLYISKGISIKDNIFKQVKFGEFQVLLYDGYLGKNFRSYLYDMAIINNKRTIFLFTDPLLNNNISDTIRINRIYQVFDFFVKLYYDLNMFYTVNTMYSTMMLYIPMVLTVRLYERVYGEKFDMKLFNPCLYTEDISIWFNQECLDLIHNMDDNMLLEYGGLVEHVDEMFSKEDQTSIETE